MKELLPQVVTLYRRENGVITRKVYENAHFQLGKKQVADPMGSYCQRQFLLILPEDADVRPGDRVLSGEGPEAESWEALTRLPLEAAQVSRVELCRLEGKAHHVEAT